MEALWDWACSQIIPGSLITTAVIGAWTQVVTKRRHKERLAVMREQTTALLAARPEAR